MTLVLLLVACVPAPDQQTTKDLEAQVAEHGDRIAALEAELAELRDELQTTPTTTTTTASFPVRLLSAATSDPNDLLLEVPAEFPSPHEALASLDDALIASDTTVTIQIAPGTYGPYLEPIDVDHRDGRNIHIVGSPGMDETATVLQFASDVDGIRVEEGRALGLVDGLTLQGPGDGLGWWPGGVRVSRGSYATVGPSVLITDFYGFGVASWWHSTVIADGVRVERCGDGFEASENGYLQARGVTVQDAQYDAYYAGDGGFLDIHQDEAGTPSTATNHDIGLDAQRQAFIRADDVQVSGSRTYAFYANNQSYLFTPDATSTGATGTYSMRVRRNSYASANRVQFADSTGTCMYAELSSGIDGTDHTATGCATIARPDPISTSVFDDSIVVDP